MSTVKLIAENQDINAVKSFGSLGGKAITGTGAVTPKTGYYFYSVIFVADSVVAAQGDVAGVNNIDLTSFTLIKAGTTFFGQWDSITLTSGEAAGYYAEE